MSKVTVRLERRGQPGCLFHYLVVLLDLHVIVAQNIDDLLLECRLEGLFPGSNQNFILLL